MSDAKDRADWDKLSVLLAITINCHVEKKSQVKPRDMNPYTIQRKSGGKFEEAVEVVHNALKQRE